MLVLKEPFKQYWKGEDPFLAAIEIDGEVFREKEGRRTLRFSQKGHSYFLKFHAGIGWGEVFKNLFQLRLPIVGAFNEFAAVNKLNQLGVDTLKIIAFGKRGLNPAQQESFLITEDLDNTISLEDYCKNWKESPPAFKVKRSLIKRIAQVTKIMHGNGINHRDYYICHFLLASGAEEKILKGEEYQCSLIDLHRAQIRKKVPLRWLIKDLAGIYYSTMDIGLSKKDIFLFLQVYTGLSLREVFMDKSFWVKVHQKATALYLKDFSKLPDEPFSQ